MKSQKVFFSDHTKENKIELFDETDESMKKYAGVVEKIKQMFDFEYAYISSLVKYIFVCVESDSLNSDNDVWHMIQIEETKTFESSGDSGAVTLDNFQEGDSIITNIDIVKTAQYNYTQIIKDIVNVVSKNKEDIIKLKESNAHLF